MVVDIDVQPHPRRLDILIEFGIESCGDRLSHVVVLKGGGVVMMCIVVVKRNTSDAYEACSLIQSTLGLDMGVVCLGFGILGWVDR